MKRLRRWWGAWVRLLDRREPGDAMALFRVAVGLVAVLSIGQLIAQGLVDALWVDLAHGGYRALGEGPYLVKWLGGPTPRVVHGLVAVALAGGALVALGLGGRVTPFVTLQAYIALQRLNGHTSGSSDLLVTNALWLLTLSRATATLSLDCRLRTGSFRSDTQISAFPRYLAVLQLVVMYWSTGAQKVSAYWLPTGNYAALYYALQQPSWQRIDMTWVAHIYPLTQVATAVTWLWEVSAPLLLVVYYLRYTADRGGKLRRWASRFDLRKPWALVGAGMHLMILLAMDVGHFSVISLSYYACLWHPDELRAAGAWTRARLGLGRSEGAPAA